jgi:hypothetical protein
MTAAPRCATCILWHAIPGSAIGECHDPTQPERRDPERRVWPLTSHAGTCGNWRVKE